MPSLSELHASLDRHANPDIRIDSPLPKEDSPVYEIPSGPAGAGTSAYSPLSDPRRFSEEQMRSLVRSVFCPGWPRPSKQVVIAAVDDDDDVSNICLLAAQALSEEVETSICIVDVGFRPRTMGQPGRSREFDSNGFGAVRNQSHQVSTNLWHASSDTFLGAQNSLSASWLRARLADLRLEFDYVLLHCPPAGLFGEAALLGYLCDGIVLVLEANSTRRVTAQKVKEKLHAANVRILGAVLNDRPFPIPEELYRRL